MFYRQSAEKKNYFDQPSIIQAIIVVNIKKKVTININLTMTCYSRDFDYFILG